MERKTLNGSGSLLIPLLSARSIQISSRFKVSPNRAMTFAPSAADDTCQIAKTTPARIPTR